VGTAGPRAVDRTKLGDGMNPPDDGPNLVGFVVGSTNRFSTTFGSGGTRRRRSPTVIGVISSS
jgi:hypothetical protein